MLGEDEDDAAEGDWEGGEDRDAEVGEEENDGREDDDCDGRDGCSGSGDGAGDGPDEDSECASCLTPLDMVEVEFDARSCFEYVAEAKLSDEAVCVTLFILSPSSDNVERTAETSDTRSLSAFPWRTTSCCIAEMGSTTVERCWKWPEAWLENSPNFTCRALVSEAGVNWLTTVRICAIDSLMWAISGSWLI